jgi:hypothetical protein
LPATATQDLAKAVPQADRLSQPQDVNNPKNTLPTEQQQKAPQSTITKEKSMKTTKGLWIDRRKAVVVAVTDKGEQVKEILSHVEKHLGRFEGARSTTPYEAQQVPADDSQERGLTGQLDKYYDEVIAQVRGTELILIFGPGEAKGELIKRIEKYKLSGRIARVETADNMTVPQIAAKVRKYFSNREPEQ